MGSLLQEWEASAFSPSHRPHRSPGVSEEHHADSQRRTGLQVDFPTPAPWHPALAPRERECITPFLSSRESAPGLDGGFRTLATKVAGRLSGASGTASQKRTTDHQLLHLSNFQTKHSFLNLWAKNSMHRRQPACNANRWSVDCISGLAAELHLQPFLALLLRQGLTKLPSHPGWA